MARRKIGQETFAFAASGGRRTSTPDDLSRLIDLCPIERRLGAISCSAKGEPVWPPPTPFKAMLVAYGTTRPMSGTRRLWMTGRHSDGFAAFRVASRHRNGPLRSSTQGPYRSWRPIAVRRDHGTAQGQGDHGKTGTLVDATIIASASKDDDEARWVKHRGKPAVHGFKAHVGADADTALVEETAVTPANINDGRASPGALPDDPGELFADSAHREPRRPEFSGQLERIFVTIGRKSPKYELVSGSFRRFGGGWSP